jgi:hypothetical protein
MLQAAGFGPAYARGSVGGLELAPYAAGIDCLQTAHEPFPALVLDAYSAVVEANRACSLLFGPDLVGANMVEVYLGSPLLGTPSSTGLEVAYAAPSRLCRQREGMPLDYACGSWSTLTSPR